ncbi:hypothetical protein VCH24_26130 [Variovorax boronicumulans]|nr:hypothetical protein VCH24_26130 [Variovorax boronicumulans]
MVTMASANMALARFTQDSMASEIRPIEFVRYPAHPFRRMVIRATATETRSSVLGVNVMQKEQDQVKRACAGGHYVAGIG